MGRCDTVSTPLVIIFYESHGLKGPIMDSSRFDQDAEWVREVLRGHEEVREQLAALPDSGGANLIAEFRQRSLVVESRGFAELVRAVKTLTADILRTRHKSTLMTADQLLEREAALVERARAIADKVKSYRYLLGEKL